MPNGEYTHYMQRIDIANQPLYDIEDEFFGVIYLTADGMNTIGKAKNVYTEDYAESDRLRYYLPPTDNDYANEATTIEMTFLIVGEAIERQRVYDRFTDYVRKGTHRYFDTARRREFRFIVQEEIKVSEEKWHGSVPYIEVTIPMQNINGHTTLIDLDDIDTLLAVEHNPLVHNENRRNVFDMQRY